MLRQPFPHQSVMDHLLLLSVFFHLFFHRCFHPREDDLDHKQSPRCTLRRSRLHGLHGDDERILQWSIELSQNCYGIVNDYHDTKRGPDQTSKQIRSLYTERHACRQMDKESRRTYTGRRRNIQTDRPDHRMKNQGRPDHDVTTTMTEHTTTMT